MVTSGLLLLASEERGGKGWLAHDSGLQEGVIDNALAVVRVALAAVPKPGCMEWMRTIEASYWIGDSAILSVTSSIPAGQHFYC